MPFQKGQSGNPARVFKKGVSGNQSGRPKGTTNSPPLRTLLRKHRQLVMDNLVSLATEAEDEKVRLAATLAIAERTDGKPRNEAPAEDEDLEPSDRIPLTREQLEALDAELEAEDAEENGSW